MCLPSTVTGNMYIIPWHKWGCDDNSKRVDYSWSKLLLVYTDVSPSVEVVDISGIITPFSYNLLSISYTIVIPSWQLRRLVWRDWILPKIKNDRYNKWDVY